MSDLIYTMAYGDEAWGHAVMMVKSLRSFGQFTGDILVFSDRSDSIPEATVCKDDSVLKLPSPIIGKAWLGRHLAVSEYDRVAWMDADIIAIGPVAPILGHAPSGQIGAAVECVITERYRYWFSMPGLPGNDGEFGYNAGLVVGAAATWNAICQQWYSLVMASITVAEKCGTDQPLFNHMNRTGLINIIPFPREWVHFLTDDSYPVSKSTILIHVKAPHKTHIMRCIIGLRESLSAA